MINDCNINNLAKNQVSAVFNLRAIGRNMSPKFIELCMHGDAMFMPLGGT